MTYESSAVLLLDLLRQRRGDEPGWTLRPNKDYGYYLLFRSAVVSFGDVRQLIVTTFGFAGEPTFILGELYDTEDGRDPATPRWYQLATRLPAHPVAPVRQRPTPVRRSPASTSS